MGQNFEQYLQNASYGFSGDSKGNILSLTENSDINWLSRHLYKICEIRLQANTFGIRSTIIKFAGLIQENYESKNTRLDKDLIFFVPPSSPIPNTWTILNPLNGSQFILTDTEIENLLVLNGTRKLNTLNPKSLAEFIESGVIIPENKSKITLPLKEDSLNIWLNVGYDCPNGCPFCWAGQNTKLSSKRYDHVKEFAPSETDEIVSGIVDSMKYLDVNKTTIKLAGGGEPLVYFKELESIVPILKEKIEAKFKEKLLGDHCEVEFVIITSGIGLNERMCEFFKENNVHVALAVGGDELGHWFSRPFKNGTNSWKHVVSSIFLLHKFDLKFNLSFVLCDRNISSIVNEESKKNIFMYFNMLFGFYIPIDFSFARPSSDDPKPIKDILNFSEKLGPLISNFFNHQQYWTGKIGYLKMDYTAISQRGAGKKYTCFAGHSYISVTSYKEPKNLLTIVGRVVEFLRLRISNTVFQLLLSKIPNKFCTNGTALLSIGACHELADTGGTFVPNTSMSMLEQANKAFLKKEGRGKKRPIMTPKESRHTCMGCALRYYCSGLDEIGGCTIQRYNEKTQIPTYCNSYSRSIETMLVEMLRRIDVSKIFLPDTNIKKYYTKSEIEAEIEIAKKYKKLLGNLKFKIDEIDALKRDFIIELYGVTIDNRNDTLHPLTHIYTSASEILNQIEDVEIPALASLLAKTYQYNQNFPSEFEFLKPLLDSNRVGNLISFTHNSYRIEEYISIVLEQILIDNKIYREFYNWMTEVENYYLFTPHKEILELNYYRNLRTSNTGVRAVSVLSPISLEI